MRISDKYIKIFILSFTILTIVGCEGEKIGKAVISKQNQSIETSVQEEDSNKNILDTIAGKCIIIDDGSTLYPTVVTFEKDSYIEYIKDMPSGSYKVLDVEVKENIVTYNVEYDNYDEVSYSDIQIEVVDGNSIRYIDDYSKPELYDLISKTQVAVAMKDYEEKIAEALIVDDEYSGYIIPDSDVRKLTRSELEQYTIEELGYIRNEIFARYGFIFGKEEYREYFSKKTWYVPDASCDGTIESVNPIEQHNVRLLKELEGITT